MVMTMATLLVGIEVLPDWGAVLPGAASFNPPIIGHSTKHCFMTAL
jgi:hypothetical protein